MSNNLFYNTSWLCNTGLLYKAAVYYIAMCLDTQAQCFGLLYNTLVRYTTLWFIVQHYSLLDNTEVCHIK